MAGLISQHFIDDLLARSDIVAVVDARVKLKKAGRNYQACCPFHTEKSPSFSISPDKQFYHCFGCGAHGNVISFLMEYERLDFVDAIEELASLHNLEVVRDEQSQTPQQKAQQRQQQQQKTSDFELMAQASRFFQQQLRQHPDKDKVVGYLKQRGLSGDTAKRFQIGFAPDGWHSLTSLMRNHQQLIDLGLAKAGQNNQAYDLFRNRLMFPIRDRRGRVIGFGGRVFDDSTPKYLNSPETRLFQKGLELYGFYEAKQAHSKLSRLVIVEGYMDVVALAQHGIDYAVASLGTATTADQLQLLFRSVPEVICCYDGDRAGRDAAWRAAENALPMLRDGIALKFVFLPDGEDPDSLVQRQGKQAFEQLLEQAMPLSQFLLQQFSQQTQTNTVEGKANLVDNLLPLINRMPDSITKDNLIEDLANRVGKTGSQLKQYTKAEPVAKQNADKPTKSSPVRLALALLLAKPQLAELLPDLSSLDMINVQGIDLLKSVLRYCQQHPDTHSGKIIEHYRDQAAGKHLAKLLCWEHHINDDAAEAVFIDALEKLLSTFVVQRTQVLLDKARSMTLTADEQLELQSLLSAQKSSA